MLAAAQLINRLPSTVLKNKSLYEVLYNKQPSMSHLRVLGCLCYSKVVQKVDKLKLRSKRVVHMGYSMTQKGYILLDLDIYTLFFSRDMLFKENIFLFKFDTSSRSVPIFPDSSLNCDYDGLTFKYKVKGHTPTSPIIQVEVK